MTTSQPLHRIDSSSHLTDKDGKSVYVRYDAAQDKILIIHLETNQEVISNNTDELARVWLNKNPQDLIYLAETGEICITPATPKNLMDKALDGFVNVMTKPIHLM